MSDYSDYRQQESVDEIRPKHVVYLVIVLFLSGLDLGQYDAQQASAEMTKEQLHAIAKDRTRTLVACAQSRNIIVGDKLVECRALDIPVREMDW